VKRLLAVAGVMASLALFATNASGQTTTVDPLTTTTVDPLTTTTVDPLTTTTVDPLTTTTTPDVTTTTEPIVLPGEHIDDGSIIIGAKMQNLTGVDCQVQGSIANQQMNLVRTETNMIGGVYGKADMGGGATIGMVLVQLGPIPTAVLAYRALGGACNQDVLGIGGYSATDTNAHFEGIGYALYPGDFANFVTADVTVNATSPTPNLDIQAAYDFLNTPRQAN
jgi:hypothetical protein